VDSPLRGDNSSENLEHIVQRKKIGKKLNRTLKAGVYHVVTGLLYVVVP
jgi:hypothetical protein